MASKSFPVPLHVAHDHRLDRLGWSLASTYLYLCSVAWNWAIDISVEELQGEFNLSRRSIFRRLAKLRSEGLIVMTKRSRKNSLIRIVSQAKDG